MHEYSERIICDKCGKIIREGDERIALWGKKHNELRLLKVFSGGGIDVMDYDFCKDCAKEIKKAIENTAKGKMNV